MAYAALISLEDTIHRFLNHHLFPISLQQKQQILSLLQYVKSFQGFLEEFPDKFNNLEGKMRKLGHEAEDSLEYLLLAKVRSSSNIRYRIKLKRVMREIYLLAETIKASSGSKKVQVETRSWDKKLKSQIMDTNFCFFYKNLRHQLPGVQGGVDSSSNASASTKIEDAMVDFEDYVLHVKERLCVEEPKLQVIPICGMGGIGKTTLAKTVYDDPLIVGTFDVRVWITVSQDYTAQRILSSLLHSLKEFDTGRLGKKDEEKVYKILKWRRYLVVMDDIWSTEAWDVVRRVFPDDGNGSRVLLTTRLSDVASYPDSSSKLFEMQLMEADQSWSLLKRKVFGDEDCPSELENIGREIAGSCKGLPLAVVVIAGVLSTVSRSLSSWHRIAGNVKESAEQNQIEDILSLSYFQLPQYLRPCFLYMGSFPEDEEINVTKLIRLWIAEGFLKCPTDSNSFEKVAEECLEELVKRNLVLVRKKKWNGRIKSCNLHDMMRDLCIKKVHESKLFLNLINMRQLGKKNFTKCMKNHRRVSVYSSNLRYLKSSHSSTIHSIRCWLHYPEKMEYFLGGVRLLRVLDAQHAHVADSPSMKQVVELFHLRYLSFTYFGKTLKGLSNLQNLQTLIIIIPRGDGIAYDLWLERCMPQLRHVYISGVIHFRDPKETSYSLGSLQTVFHLSHWSCTERILKNIPNLKKLKVDCSGGGEAACLNDLVHLHRLESLEVYAGWPVETRPKKYNVTFPKMLKKLILSSLELLWNDIFVVGSLPYLQMLKLKACTCIGGTWETTKGEFSQLEFLLIEDCDFENWITESSHFPRLKRLLLRSCWGLNGIPKDIGEIPTLEVIEVKGLVMKSLLESAEAIQNEQEDYGNSALHVIYICSDGEDNDDRDDEALEELLDGR